MSLIVRNKIILILGRPGEGKTFLASMIASCYRRIYSNVNLTDREGNTISNYIENVEYLDKIPFHPEKGVVLLDEGGINLNARESGTTNNKAYGELGMLGRKLNVDIIVCAQLGRMIDVYYRELASYIFEMHAWFERKDYLMFESKIYTAGGETLVKVCRFDLFEWSRLTGISYNTLEKSRIERKSRKEKVQILAPGKSVIDERIKDYAPIWTTEAQNAINNPIFAG